MENACDEAVHVSIRLECHAAHELTRRPTRVMLRRLGDISVCLAEVLVERLVLVAF